MTLLLRVYSCSYVGYMYLNLWTVSVSYCSDFYGIVLWDMSLSTVESV